jgi:hypothetical protein
MACLSSPSRRKQQAKPLSRSSLKARNALVLEHLPLAVAARFRGAVAIATATAQRLFPLVEREDLIQVAQEALVSDPSPRYRDSLLFIEVHLRRSVPTASALAPGPAEGDRRAHRRSRTLCE